MRQPRLEDVSAKVRAFYEECSYPGYEEFETPYDLAEKAGRGIYTKLLDEQLPLGIRILDAGCGTGQFGNFLSVMNRNIIGIDFSFASLKKGHEFQEKFGLQNSHFFQMDIFHAGFKDEVFDYVFCNGMLHHTSDAYGGFQILCRLVKRGGYIVIGLYNKWGRLLLDLRRLVFRFTHNKLLCLDFFMRQRSMGRERKRIWYLDQYRNPHEDKFSVGEVLTWFRRQGIEFVNCIPKITLGDRLSVNEQLFQKHDGGTGLDHVLVQLGWVFTQGKEGGYFVMIGRKR